MTLELTELFYIAITIGIASGIHGYGGFGYGYISITLFSILSLNIVAASYVLTLVSFPVSLFLAYIDGQKNPINWKIFGIVSAGFIPAVPIGVLFIVHFGQTEIFQVAFGGLLLLFCLYNLRFSGKRYRIAPWTGPLFGIVGGFLGGAIVSGGPPVVIYAYGQTDDPRELKGTMQLIFIIASLTRLVSLRVIQGVGSGGYYVEGALIALPVLLLIRIGHRLSLKTSVARFRLVVNVVLLGFGLYLVLNALT